MDSYGIRGVGNLWFKWNPSNWKQCTEVNYVESTKQVSERYTSDFKEIKHSVALGSVLGPILFLLHVKDLPYNIQGAKMVLFADDVKIQLKATNEAILNQKNTQSYAAATNLVSCKWVRDKYWEDYSIVLSSTLHYLHWYSFS